MRSDNAHRQVTSAVSDGWMEGGAFLNSILAGTLLGFFADKWLGTDPWLVVLGIAVGAYSGFMKVWHFSKRLEEMSRDR
ncbi:MAG: AtpZ/AtpI family protein [Acidimicrobiia bacterium]